MKISNADLALNLLSDRETQVIIKIYGLDGNPPLKQKEIAAEWDTKPQWISQVKLSAISNPSAKGCAKLEAAKLAKAEATEQDQNSSPPEVESEES